jgi:hypothetical protein
MTTVAVGMAIAFLMQRNYVHAEISECNAIVSTLAVVLPHLHDVVSDLHD